MLFVPFMRTFRQLRRDLKYSQGEFGDILGVKQPQISKWERYNEQLGPWTPPDAYNYMGKLARAHPDRTHDVNAYLNEWGYHDLQRLEATYGPLESP